MSLVNGVAKGLCASASIIESLIDRQYCVTADQTTTRFCSVHDLLSRMSTMPLKDPGENSDPECFHCTEEINKELSSLSEPMTEIEGQFILERCLFYEREKWVKEIQSLLPSREIPNTATSETFSFEKAIQRVGDERNVNSSNNLEICHICGCILC
jgi:hypothetical protein